MASENKMKDKFSQMTSRQKAIIGAMIIVVLIIGWQVMGLMGGGSAPKPITLVPVNKIQATKSAVGAGSTMSNSAPSASSSPEQGPAGSAQHADEPRQQAIVNEPQFMKLQKITEEKYIGKLSELEDLKIQKQIAETNQAITAAKLATVSAEKDISDLLTKPQPVPVPQSAYANQLVAPTTAGAPGSGMMPPPPIPKSEPIIEYSLISVSMQLNRWNAVLGFQGKLFSVGVGDTLPPDGSVVVSINKNSIILRKDDKRRRVGIVSSI